MSVIFWTFLFTLVVLAAAFVPRRKSRATCHVHPNPLAYQAEHYRDKMYED